jgi:predicted patatin/cPLA2 family phospholipase
MKLRIKKPNIRIIKPKIIKNYIDRIEKKKIYSGINNIKMGKASLNITEGVILLQGGAFRGVYTSGVIDFLMEKDINFRHVVGVSAGALNGMNYVSGDIGRGALINLKHRHDPSWIGLKALFSKGNNGIIGFTYALGDYNNEYPFDEDRFFNSGKEFIATATCLEDGRNHYFKNDSNTIYKAIMASASMPYISKPVEINGKHYLDGGCMDSLPIKYVRNKYRGEKIVVVMTRPLGFRVDTSQNSKITKVNYAMYKKYPLFIESLNNMDERLNIDFKLIEELSYKNKIFVIAPSEPIDISRLEGDMEKLGSLYRLGYEDMERRYDQLIEFLNN